MDKEQFWKLIDEARAQEPAGADGDAVARRASALLAVLPVAEITATQQVLWDLLGESYRGPLWAAAHLVNGGCSDDGFDYFRGWLILQGREAFERAVADPDTLATLPQIRAAAPTGCELECERALALAWDAHRARTGADLPAGAFTISYPALDPAWAFDFDDTAELSRRLPALARLYGMSG
ncbi:DUF4240 domain-containing protein [Streptomyces bambusae]|uniref:DUF4240 domain-containing protein n=1 Tax=Streptomyces bambusae TaxID=1550616 RepID=UPI001CFEB895|nr:DUF4240 domain-containing protein [Streptomyces bambusae]MCB5164060.1 DUF4240 domain-containing protein [Streptomyces bambusae]